MATAELACIVEGHGEVESVPILIRRVAATVDPGLYVKIPAVIRTPKSKLLKDGELERAVALASRKLSGIGGVLVLIDSDDDCTAELGPELFRRARGTRADVPIAVILAKHEFENWFIAAAESLRGFRGLPADLQPPDDPEAIEAAKGWISQRMRAGNPYSETIDQPAFTNKFSLESAMQADSFKKCRRDIARLFSEVALA